MFFLPKILELLYFFFLESVGSYFFFDLKMVTVLLFDVFWIVSMFQRKKNETKESRAERQLV
jgi:hypothetical protein